MGRRARHAPAHHVVLRLGLLTLGAPRLHGRQERHRILPAKHAAQRQRGFAAPAAPGGALRRGCACGCTAAPHRSCTSSKYASASAGPAAGTSAARAASAGGRRAAMPPDGARRREGRRQQKCTGITGEAQPGGEASRSAGGSFYSDECWPPPATASSPEEGRLPRRPCAHEAQGCRWGALCRAVGHHAAGRKVCRAAGAPLAGATRHWQCSVLLDVRRLSRRQRRRIFLRRC